MRSSFLKSCEKVIPLPNWFKKIPPDLARSLSTLNLFLLSDVNVDLSFISVKMNLFLL